MKIVIAAAALAAMAGSAMAQEMMSAEELAAYVTGRTVTGTNPETGDLVGTVSYAEDGSSVLTMANGREESGSWRLDGDAYCTRYAAFRDNSENCFRLEPLADGRTQAWYTDGRKALILEHVD
jgi:hypothetical protein